MSTNKEKEMGLMFYGNTHIPLSIECSGCFHFNYVCPGSTFRGECPTGDVTDMKPSHVASEILNDDEVKGNYFLLARISDFDLNDEWYLDHMKDLEEKIQSRGGVGDYAEALKKAIKNYEYARSVDESVITKLQQTYNTKETLYIELKNEEIEMNTESKPLIDLDDDDLEF